MWWQLYLTALKEQDIFSRKIRGFAKLNFETFKELEMNNTDTSDIPLNKVLLNRVATVIVFMICADPQDESQYRIFTLFRRSSKQWG